MPDPREPRNEALLWGYIWLALNVVVLIAVGAVIPVFLRMSRNLNLPQSRILLFYFIAAIAMGNAIRRIILQWMKLKRLHRDGT